MIYGFLTLVLYNIVIGVIVFAATVFVLSGDGNSINKRDMFFTCVVFGVISIFFVLEQQKKQISNLFNSSEFIKKILERQYVLPTKANKEQHLIRTLSE